MPDSFTDVSSQSWFGRIGGAIKGFIFGLILIPLSIALLFWNEGRAVKTELSLKEGAAAVVSVTPDNIVPANDQKLVHLSGEVTTGDPVRDPIFNVSATALRLNRRVEMYQWKEESHSETHKKLGGGEETETHYEYKKEWSDRPVESSSFKHPEGHTNPGTFPISESTAVAAKATLGAFKIPQDIIRKMNGDEALPATAESIASLGPDLKAKAKLSGDKVYLGAEPEAPAVGDLRVSFHVLKPGTFSILAQQTADTLGPYPTHEGREIERVESGTMSAALMFQHAQSENNMVTWLVRLGGFIGMFIGFAVLLNPLQVFADIVPFIGSIIGFGTGLLAGMLAFVGSLVVIAIAWLTARPLLGGSLLVLAVVALIYAMMRVSKHHQVATAGARPA